MQWHARRKRRGDDFTDPYGAEIFTDGSLDTLADALVNETLQNALDAGRGVDRGGKPVRVRFTLRSGHKAMPRVDAQHWFGDLRPHLEASFPDDGFGRSTPLPHADDKCDFLLIEDFGTCGLTGDPASDDSRAGTKRNHFVDFLRSDGRTHKSAGEAGSWGIGKNVFPLASRVMSFLAYTVRADDGQTLAMGKAILKNRNIAGEQWQPACYCCESWSEAGGPPVPESDPERLQRFREDFHLHRRDEPGLSVVLPWLQPELRFDDIESAVFRRYGWAILSGSLAVTLDGGTGAVTLDPESIGDYAPNEDSRLSLAQKLWARRAGEKDIISLPAAISARWRDLTIPESDREALRTRLDAGERVALRVPLDVPLPNGSATTRDHFTVYLSPNDRKTRPEFVREHLTLPDVRGAASVRGVRVLVVINEGPLANLLRAAEPPNHTNWDAKTRNFKDAFRDKGHVIAFVKTAGREIMKQAREKIESLGDAKIFENIFSVPVAGSKAGGGRRRTTPVEDGTTPDDEPDIPRPLQRLRLHEVDGGFVIRRGEPGSVPYRSATVRIAYDVASGSPWKSYEPADFDLLRKDRSGITVATDEAAAVEIIDSNRIRVDFFGDDYEVVVTGFDTNRDLHVTWRGIDDPDAPGAEDAPDADAEGVA